MVTQLEKELTPLMGLINGQYPRPWVTDSEHPEESKVFIVGANPATDYGERHGLNHEKSLDIHFNRNGFNCREFYSAVRSQENKSSSPSRVSIEGLRRILNEQKVTDILETNLFCYSTSRLKDLTEVKHPGGKARGLEIFRTLLRCIRPKVVIVHGAKVRSEFSAKIGHVIASFPTDPIKKIPVQTTELFRTELKIETHPVTVFTIPSLAAPGANHWSSWAEGYLAELAKGVRSSLK